MYLPPEREREIGKTHLSEGGSGRARLLGLMRCRRYRREGCVRRVWCVRCVRCQRRVVLLTAVTTGAPHLEVRTCLVTVIPRFLLYHHSCTEKDIAPTGVGSISSRFERQLIRKRSRPPPFFEPFSRSSKNGGRRSPFRSLFLDF